MNAGAIFSRTSSSFNIKKSNNSQQTKNAANLYFPAIKVDNFCLCTTGPI